MSFCEPLRHLPTPKWSSRAGMVTFLDSLILMSSRWKNVDLDRTQDRHRNRNQDQDRDRDRDRRSWAANPLRITTQDGAAGGGQVRGWAQPGVDRAGLYLQPITGTWTGRRTGTGTGTRDQDRHRDWRSWAATALRIQTQDRAAGGVQVRGCPGWGTAWCGLSKTLPGFGWLRLALVSSGSGWLWLALALALALCRPLCLLGPF